MLNGSPNGISGTNGTNGRISLRPGNADSGYIKLFKFFGLDLAKDSQQLQGDCPFPDCPNPVGHFFANPTTGLWDCKRCGRKGNVYEFIREFHAACFALTTTEQYEALAEKRKGISAWTLHQFQLAVNPVNGEWMLPAYSLKGNMVNLYCYKQQSTAEGPVMTVMSAPTFKQLLFGLQHFRKERIRPLWVLEGHWDLMAFWEYLELSDMRNGHDCVGVPGAGTLPDEDVSLLSMRDVRLCYDNDDAGEKGILHVAQKLGRNSITPMKFSRITWDKSYPKGFDVRDEVIKLGVAGNLLTALSDKLTPITVDLKKMANEAYNPTARSLPCATFNDLCDSVASKLYLPVCLQDTLAITTAIACSTSLGGKPLWGYIIGPPSSGKTTLVELYSTAHNLCFGISKMTGLLSGYFKEGMGDASILPKLQDKCVMIKDFTTILNMSPQIQDTIFGELRDMYDGSTAAYYRNHQHRVFKDIRFNMVACVTDKIRSYNQTDLGERFIQVEFDSYWDETGRIERESVDRKVLMETAIRNVLSRISNQDNSDNFLGEQRGLAWGFLEHLVDRIRTDNNWVQSKVDSILEHKDFLFYIDNLANWCAHARSIVQRDKDKQILFRPRVEYGQRLGEQLTKLAIATCLVLDEDSDSDRVKAIVRKVALDTGISFQQEIMLAICHSTANQMSCNQLAYELNLSETAILNRLRDMQELGILKTHIPAIRSRGNQPHIYTLADNVKEFAAELGFTKKKEAASKFSKKE